jgi:hypothetical protein
MAGYKVRLDDGSEIGPLDAEMVRSWYQQGLIGPDSPVLRAGSKRWTKLALAFNLQEMGTTSETRRRATAQASARARSETAPGGPQRWRTYVAGALFLVGAAGAAYGNFAPERWIPELARTPWREIGLAELVFALCLIRGWEIGRRIVRVAVFLVAFGLFALAGIFLAQGAGAAALLVLASVWLVASGFVALLAGGHLIWPQSTLSLIVILAGGAGVWYFGFLR